MHITKTISTAYGRRLAAEPATVTFASSADRAALAARLDLEADLALAAGDGRLADRLSWRAHAMRPAAAEAG